MENSLVKTSPAKDAVNSKHIHGTLGGTLTAILACLIAASYLLVFQPLAVAKPILQEDGPVEQGTALCFLIASATFLFTWRMCRHAKTTASPFTERTFYCLLLAIFTFICMGEEISWGQRIFGWRTPSAFAVKNAQGETNLHNLAIIEGGVRHEKTRTFIHLLTNPNRLFFAFTFTYFFLIPIAHRTSSHARKVIATLGIPVPSVALGLLAITNHIGFFFGVRHLKSIDLAANPDFPMDEIKELDAALIFATAGSVAWLHALREKSIA